MAERAPKVDPRKLLMPKKLAKAKALVTPKALTGGRLSMSRPRIHVDLAKDKPRLAASLAKKPATVPLAVAEAVPLAAAAKEEPYSDSDSQQSQ